jgi:hypothetical protein
MNELKLKMIAEARKKYKSIYPCGNRSDLVECFTKMGDLLAFWFNTEDHSTHLLTLPLEDNEI